MGNLPASRSSSQSDPSDLLGQSTSSCFPAIQTDNAVFRSPTNVKRDGKRFRFKRLNKRKVEEDFKRGLSERGLVADRGAEGGGETDRDVESNDGERDEEEIPSFEGLPETDDGDDRMDTDAAEPVGIIWMTLY